MPLARLSTVLGAAARHGYAVGAFNVTGLDYVYAIMEAAQKAESPVILSLAEVHFAYVAPEDIIPAMRRAAQQARVPVAIHLDHGVTQAAIERCLPLGFTSVMFDGSTLPYEENVACTAQICRQAHERGIDVEAELGHVTGGESGLKPSSADPACFTNPTQAADFLQRTGIDALAVAIGSVHGLFHGTPQLDLPRLQAIRTQTGIPLVLHGGSGIPQAQVQEAIRLGIAKVNVFTEMALAASAVSKSILSQEQVLSFSDVLLQSRQGITDVALAKMRMFGSAGRATQS